VLVAVSAVTVALVQDVLRQAMLFAIYGLTLVALFVILQAPDVALSELVVSTVAFPLVVLAALARTTK
jgi:uncharacterized MnhB-related membrane protein